MAKKIISGNLEITGDLKVAGNISDGEHTVATANLESILNKVTSISNESTDTQYPSAKCVYDNEKALGDRITNLENFTVDNGVISSALNPFLMPENSSYVYNADWNTAQVIPFAQYGWVGSEQKYTQKRLRIGDGLSLASPSSGQPNDLYTLKVSAPVKHTRYWVPGGNWSYKVPTFEGKVRITLRLSNSALQSGNDPAHYFNLYAKTWEGNNVQIATTTGNIDLSNLYEITFYCDRIGNYTKVLISYRKVGSNTVRPSIGAETFAYIEMCQYFDIWDLPGDIYIGWSTTPSAAEVPVLVEEVYE